MVPFVLGGALMAHPGTLAHSPRAAHPDTDCFQFNARRKEARISSWPIAFVYGSTSARRVSLSSIWDAQPRCCWARLSHRRSTAACIVAGV